MQLQVSLDALLHVIPSCVGMADSAKKTPCREVITERKDTEWLLLEQCRL